MYSTPEILLSEKLQKFFNKSKEKVDRGLDSGK